MCLVFVAASFNKHHFSVLSPFALQRAPITSCNRRSRQEATNGETKQTEKREQEVIKGSNNNKHNNDKMEIRNNRTLAGLASSIRSPNYIQVICCCCCCSCCCAHINKGDRKKPTQQPPTKGTKQLPVCRTTSERIKQLNKNKYINE